MDIEKLAEITAQEFSSVHGRIDQLDSRMDKMDAKIDKLAEGQVRLESSVKAVLNVVLELPSKKVIEKLVHRVEDIDERVTVVEHKLQPAH